tara:strand:- start:60562 stop:60762 length:201 start_codon:yes stop_codon:yes gene_type:complete
MTDLVDCAQELEQRHRDKALSRRVPRPQIGCSHCIDCGAEIATARRAAYPSAERCIDCQKNHEGQR